MPSPVDDRESRYIEEFGIRVWNLISKESREILLKTEPAKPFNRDYVDLNTGEKIK